MTSCSPSNNTAGDNALQVSLQLFRLDKPALDSGALVSIHLSHLIPHFGAIVEAACLLVSVSVQRLLPGMRVTWMAEDLPESDLQGYCQRC